MVPIFDVYRDRNAIILDCNTLYLFNEQCKDMLFNPGHVSIYYNSCYGS